MNTATQAAYLRHLASANTSSPTVIEPANGWAPLNIRELWEYRELLYFLIWRDVKVRYKQTLLGAAWAIIQPLSTMLVFSLFFGRLAKIPSDGIPYPIFCFAALVPWMFFASGVSNASESVIGHANMIKKVYLPRVLVPLAAIGAGGVDLMVSSLVLLALVAYYGIMPTSAMVYLPVYFVLAMITSIGAALWLSALNVQFRDIRYVIPFLLQFWLFATPIAYPSSLLSEPWRTLYGLNPMAGVVEGVRWALLGTQRTPGGLVYVSALAALCLFITGLYYFRRTERGFADTL